MSVLCGAKLSAVSVVLPKECLDLASVYSDTKRIMQITGIKKVRVAPKNKTVSDYCTIAAERLIQVLNFDRTLIDGIIFVSPQFDYILPGTAGIIQRRLDLKTNLVAFDINQGCTGFIYGLFQGFMLVQNETCQNVLVCCGDNPTRYINEKDKSLRMTTSDGASAFIVTKSGQTTKVPFAFFTDGRGLENLYIPAGGHRLPKKSGVTDLPVEDDEGNIRTLENIHSNGTELMKFDIDTADKILNLALNEINLTKENIDMYFLHQSSAFIIKRMIKKYKLDSEKVPICLENFGNIGPASIALAMCHTAKEHRLNLSKVALLAFGAGLSCAATILDLSETYFLDLFFD